MAKSYRSISSAIATSSDVWKWPTRIMKSGNFATRHDQPSNRLWVTRSALQTIAKMDRTDLVLVSSLATVITHGDQADPIG